VLTIDASVLVAAAVADEPAHEVAGNLLRAVGRSWVAIHEPAIAVVEIAAGIVRRTGDVRLAEDAVRLLVGLPGAAFHDLDLASAVQAAGVAGQLRVRAGDALYASVALAFGCTLVTLDEELLRRTAPLVDACTPETWMARQVA
jgi:predicted nucleic acid-binding protein